MEVISGNKLTNIRTLKNSFYEAKPAYLISRGMKYFFFS